MSHSIGITRYSSVFATAVFSTIGDEMAKQSSPRSLGVSRLCCLQTASAEGLRVAEAASNKWFCCAFRGHSARKIRRAGLERRGCECSHRLRSRRCRCPIYRLQNISRSSLDQTSSKMGLPEATVMTTSTRPPAAHFRRNGWTL